MRRMVLSESVRSEKGCTPLSATRLRRSNGFCAVALCQSTAIPFRKDFIPEFSDQLHVGERRRAMRGLARVRVCVTAIGRATNLAFIADEEVAGIRRGPVR
jgi:hypothetical protein